MKAYLVFSVALRKPEQIDALKSAQKHLLSIPKYSESKYWAGFVLLDALN